MQRYDVIIVGGGPSGSTCARVLRSAGKSVLIWDRQTFPRDKTCAGWVTPPVLELLEIDPDEYDYQRVLQPITGFRTGILGGKEIETRYKTTVSFGIRRCEFDHYLLERCDADCRLGEAISSLERIGDGWVLNGEVASPLLIGAGGHFCPVARLLGNRRDKHSSVVTAQEAEFEIPGGDGEFSSVEPETPELFFYPDLRGYAWVFRKQNFLNIGIGRVGESHVSDYVKTFCEFLEKRGKVRGSIPGKFHGHAYQLYTQVTPKLVDDGVLLIGDSAGLAYAQSGEGIRPAVESAVLASQTILEADGDYDRLRLQAYGRRIEKRFGHPGTPGFAGWLPQRWLEFAARKCLSSQWFARNVILDNWFLHTGEHALEVPQFAASS